jgi:hypothetical protein
MLKTGMQPLNIMLENHINGQGKCLQNKIINEESKINNMYINKYHIDTENLVSE